MATLIKNKTFFTEDFAKLKDSRKIEEIIAQVTPLIFGSVKKPPGNPHSMCFGQTQEKLKAELEKLDGILKKSQI